jgi:hypothetical protein
VLIAKGVYRPSSGPDAYSTPLHSTEVKLTGPEGSQPPEAKKQTLLPNLPDWAKKILLLIARFVKNAASWLPSAAMGVVLVAVWDGSFHAEPDNAKSLSLPMRMIMIFVCLVIIFYADALEVAYSLLRHKEKEQFGVTGRKIMKQIHDKEKLVYEGREWLVTALIAVITICCEVDQVYTPLRKVAKPNHWIWNWSQWTGIPTPIAHTLFIALFTSFVVLWFAQGPAKTIARMMPERMIDAGSLVWRIGIRTVGRITDWCLLDEPFALACRLWKYVLGDGQSSLKPSDRHYFLASVQRYGYAMDNIVIRITVNDDEGSCVVEERVVYYVLARPNNVFERRLGFPAAQQVGFKEVAANAYAMKIIDETSPLDEIDEIMEDLDALAEDKNARGDEIRDKRRIIGAKIDITSHVDKERDVSKTAPAGQDTSKSGTGGVRNAIENENQKSVSNEGANTSETDPAAIQAAGGVHLVHYRIGTNGTIPIPSKIWEALEIPNGLSVNDRRKLQDSRKPLQAFAIVAEFRACWGPGSFYPKDEVLADEFNMNFDCPCRRYRLTLDTAEKCTFRAAEVNAEAVCGYDPHWGERDRLQQSLGPDLNSRFGIHCDLGYPFPGTKYKLTWKWSKKAKDDTCSQAQRIDDNRQAETPPPPTSSAVIPPPPNI